MQDPNLILEEYGADALRLYLINSPVVRAESLRFRQEGVLAVVKDVFLPWYTLLGSSCCCPSDLSMPITSTAKPAGSRISPCLAT